MPNFGPGTRSVFGIPLVPDSMPAVRSFNDGEGGGYFPQRYAVSGVTKDSTGTPLGNCQMHLFRTNNDSIAALGTSNGSGNYSLGASPAVQHYVVAYLPGAPDVAGTTVNTLVGVPDGS